MIERTTKTLVREDGMIDRDAVAQRVFSDANLRSALNRVTHARIVTQMASQVLEAFLAGAACVVLDVPLLFETGLYKWCHTTLLVDWYLRHAPSAR